MRNILKLIAVAFVTLALSTSCSKQKIAENIQSKIAIEGIESISGSMADGWMVSLKVKNGTGYEPTLQVAEADLLVDDLPTAHLSLMAPVTMEKRAYSTIDIPVELKLTNQLKAMSLLLRARDKSLNNVHITLTATIELMGIKKDIKLPKTPVGTLLKQLGYSLE